MQYSVNTLEYQWMPFTSNRDFKEDPKLLVRGEGVYVWSHKGTKIIDGSSGLFCTPLGHCRPEIAEAVYAQLKELDYTPHFQRGHPSSFELAARIAKLTPEGINRVFFTNSGSEAVDTAMKIALAYHAAKGDGQRHRFVSRERAYHGVNMGGVSLSGLVKNREAFGPGLPGVHHMRHTHLPEHKFVRGQPTTGVELAEDLARLAANYGPGTIAACFVEPIAGSTGALVPPVGYLERLREICDEHGILLVFDEVICGFGRTGSAFASQEFDVTPDIITMAKALTNGAQPMGAVAVKEEIYETVVGNAAQDAVELFHGYTYSGHPAACAAGIATMEVFERENLFARAAEMSGKFLDSMFSLQDIPAVTDIRGYGMLCGIDLSLKGRPGMHGHEVQKVLFEAGLHLKATGDTLLVAPPFVIEHEQIDEIASILRAVLSSE
jgi:beta-alanine--pyruvate transaminase